MMSVTRREFVAATGSALAVDLGPGQSIPNADLLRLEGLGDNCELGFVLRRMGFENGMLFRWASIRPESLLATLRGDFTDLYRFENLVPQTTKMVRDLHYGTAWHTQMYSALQQGTLTFIADEEHRREIHAREAAKLNYLAEKLRRKFEHPDPIFVIKSNSGINADLLESIHYQIYRRAQSPQFLLLEVQDHPGRAGTVELLDRNRMRGYVSRFAGYDRADDGDDASWISVLKQALAYKPTATARAPAQRPGIIVLPFPSQPAPDPRSPMPGDLRGGMPSLTGGNNWCRIIDDDTYRLHAVGRGASATSLQWTGVYLPNNYELQVQAACAVEDSLPVQATLLVQDAVEGIAELRHTFEHTEADLISLAVPPTMQNPLRVTLRVESAQPLKANDRSVIDVASIQAVPRS